MDTALLLDQEWIIILETFLKAAQTPLETDRGTLIITHAMHKSKSLSFFLLQVLSHVSLEFGWALR
jgi:hypothetical protein